MNKTIYRQYDSRWGSKPYPTKASTFSGNGCGCVACTHVLIELKKYKNTTPETVRQYMVAQGFAVAHQGTSWSGIPKTLNHYGFKATEHNTLQELFKVLDKRKKNKQLCLGVILFGAGSRGGVTWTAGGHYVAFTDYKVENGKHYFYTKDSGPRCNDGWHAYETTMRGLVPKIWSAEAPKEAEPKGYTGKIPTLKITKTNAQAIADAIKWAKWIASDNRFHYGYGKHAHHNGCYFCGTQRLKKGHGIKEYEHTYCCNPFVGACWAHGACDPTARGMCQDCDSWDFGTGSDSYDKSPLFDKVSTKSLKAGDVLCGDSHVALYIGNGKVVQAGHEDDNKINSKSWNDSIAVGTWNGYKRAYRYKGKVNASMALRHGEISDRVSDLQNFLNWYSDGKFFKECGSADGIFGDNTFKWVKMFQKDAGLTAGGVVGTKTIKAMENWKK